ncbi:MAG: hypothetical protein SWX82_06515 [Cyanobacteriota bacterium]|nr:hypothetical protein [Cyanobacteriota bacterium]
MKGEKGRKSSLTPLLPYSPTPLLPHSPTSPLTHSLFSPCEAGTQN